MSFVDQHVYIIKTFIPGLTVCYYHVGFFFEQLYIKRLVQNVLVNFYPAYPWHPDISENDFIDFTGAEYIQCSFGISNSIY